MSESNGTKRLIIVGSIIVGVLLIILLATWLFSKKKPTYVGYEKAVELIQKAAVKYYEKNNDKLPVEDGDYTLTYNTLVDANLIVPLNELLTDGDDCSAHVIVTNKSNIYTYTPYLNCKDKYQTIELYKVITDPNNVVTSGNGLYYDEKMGYYFKGDMVNNYIKLGKIERNSNEVDNVWRIISIEPDNTIRIRKEYPTNSQYSWDDRYNSNANQYYGYNTFEVSRIKETLETLANRNSVLSEVYRNKIVAKKLCVGARSLNDTSKDGSAECSTLSEKEYNFGLLYPYEYLRASLDENCKKLEDYSCTNYNFLYTSQKNEWTLNKNPESTYDVLSFDGSSYKYAKAKNEYYLYLTAYLNSKSFFASGSGTKEDPYIIK